MRNQIPALKHLSTFLAVSLAAGILLVSGLTAAPAIADDEPPSGFPSWSDVEAAKGNAAATALEVSKIGKLLDSLDDEAGALGAAAVEAGAQFALTQQKLDAAAAEVGILNAQAGRAAAHAAKYKKDAVAVAVQSYKNGGTGLGFFATVAALESPESLNGVELMQQVGEQAALKQAMAVEAQSAATSLEKTRRAAQDAQAALADQARSSRDAAVTAQEAVVAQLDATEEHSTTLTAQLAVLNDTTLAKEAEYRQGQQAIAAYNQAQAAKRQAAQEAREAEARRKAEAGQQQPAAPNPGKPNPGNPNPPPNPGNPDPTPKPPVEPNPGGGYIPVDVLLPNIPGGAVNDPAGAKAYASSRLGAYGWGQGEFRCLNLLWERESNWRTNATNPYSGAYGIAQALPPGKYGTAGADWLTNYRTQIEWGLGYIKNRYGAPCGAWNHSETVGWY